MSKVLKEIIIMLLVCLVTMLVLAIALYQYIPSKKSVPEITTYVASEDVQDLLTDNIKEQTTEVVVDTYEVTSSDLSSYQSSNDYVPGKSNPFAAYVATVESDETGTTESASSTTSSTSSSSETQSTTTTNETTQSSTPSVYSENTSTK